MFAFAAIEARRAHGGGGGCEIRGGGLKVGDRALFRRTR